MLLLGGKTTLNGAHYVRRHAMPPTSTGNPLQEGGDLSARASHKSSPITRPNRARYRPAQLRINRGEAALQKRGRGMRARPRRHHGQTDWMHTRGYDYLNPLGTENRLLEATG